MDCPSFRYSAEDSPTPPNTAQSRGLWEANKQPRSNLGFSRNHSNPSMSSSGWMVANIEWARNTVVITCRPRCDTAIHRPGTTQVFERGDLDMRFFDHRSRCRSLGVRHHDTAVLRLSSQISAVRSFPKL